MSLRSRFRKKPPSVLVQNAVLKAEQYKGTSRAELKQYARAVGADTSKYKWTTSKAKMMLDIVDSYQAARFEAERGNPAMQDRILSNVEKAKRGELYAEETAAEKETVSSKEKRKKLFAGGGGGGLGGESSMDSELMKYVLYAVLFLILLGMFFSLF